MQEYIANNPVSGANSTITTAPFENELDQRTEQQRAADTLAAIDYFSQLFAQYGILGLIEPLGFPVSSLRSYRLAGDLIKAAKSPFKLVLDTFHHHLAGLAVHPYSPTVDVDLIGLVHLSGVEDGRPVAQLADEQRIMLSPQDKLQSKQQVIELEKLGYRGNYTFEPFSSTLHNWTASEIEAAITTSIDLLNQ